MNKNPHVAVVGATGAVGIEMIKTLEKRNFPVGKLILLASARSVGKKLKFKGQDITVTELFGSRQAVCTPAAHTVAR